MPQALKELPEGLVEMPPYAPIVHKAPLRTALENFVYDSSHPGVYLNEDDINRYAKNKQNATDEYRLRTAQRAVDRVMNNIANADSDLTIPDWGFMKPPQGLGMYVVRK